MTYPVVYTPEPTRPSRGAQVGTKRLQTYVVNDWATDSGHEDVIDDLGIWVPRDICGHEWPHWTCTGSQHAAGRAADDEVPVVRPAGHIIGHALAAWLIANHAALGIQEVIFAGMRWTNQTLTWHAYHGRDDHFGHVHWAQTQEAAANLTDAQIRAVKPTTPEDDMPAQAPYSLWKTAEAPTVWRVAADAQSRVATSGKALTFDKASLKLGGHDGTVHTTNADSLPWLKSIPIVTT